ncbi:unnamed protein product [Lupinus luteus]|uniref:Uncharacterized protein n=1 Tax=Lupinus luteus TaxID=3873 RepID=A0AAV1WNG5_LUPLU
MVHYLELSERASRSEKHHDIAIQGMQKLIADLDRLELEESKEDFGNLTNQITLKDSKNAITLRDPPIVATKGRPRTLRMKGGYAKFLNLTV